MTINMDIRRYSGCFHDGGVINISQFNDEIEISMESNQVFPKWNPERIPLSKYETIRGKLHLTNEFTQDLGLDSALAQLNVNKALRPKSPI